MRRLYCPTEQAILLVGVPDANGVLKFPVTAGTGGAPGLHFTPKALLSIDQQLVAEASRVLGRDLSTRIDVVQEFADDVVLEGGVRATLYLGTVGKDLGLQADPAWEALPTMMRAMPKDRSRLPYLRAWQVLTGALTLNTKALDLDEVKKHLLESDT